MTDKPAPTPIPNRGRRDPEIAPKIVALRQRQADATLLRAHAERVEAENQTLRADLKLARERADHADMRARTYATQLAQAETARRELEDAHPHRLHWLAAAGLGVLGYAVGLFGPR